MRSGGPDIDRQGAGRMHGGQPPDRGSHRWVALVVLELGTADDEALMSETEKEHWHPATAAAHALGWEDEATRSLIPPIHLTRTYLRDPHNQYRTGRTYGRPHNPTHEVPERLLSHLEGGAAAMLFSSGMAAPTADLLAPWPAHHGLATTGMY